MLYLRLIRWPNLLMIILMQVLIRFTLVEPIILFQGKALLMTNIEFFTLVFSCVCIAAGGYIINDIEDVSIDRINKPDKVIVGKKLSNDTAYNLYLGFTFVGVLSGFYLSFIKEYKYIGIIELVIAGLLYFYATTYKCIPVLGNLIVAFLTAFSVWIIILPEPFARQDSAILTLVFAYMIFAFLLTMVRELVKDLQDIEGDNSCGCKTLPVSVGERITKIIAVLFTLSVLLILGWVQWKSQQWNSLGLFLYLVIFVQLPLLILTGQIIRAKNNKEFGRASLTSKLIMFTGVISMIIFYFSF